jgi:hypothetical protein
VTASLLLYAACTACAAGTVSLVAPLRVLGIRSRRAGLALAAAGLATVMFTLSWPAAETVVPALRTALDEFAPAYQFSEQQAIPVRASAIQVYDAIMTVSADEIPGFRLLAWIRRGGTTGPESILNPPDGVPLIRVATRTSFVTLAARPGREFVMGTVVIAPLGVRLAIDSSPESFKTLTQPGFAKAALGFRIEPGRDGWCVLRTETRVMATDYVSRATFARYWRVIAPGSAFVRVMWLRAIKIRAETSAGAPQPPPSPVWKMRTVAPVLPAPGPEPPIL